VCENPRKKRGSGSTLPLVASFRRPSKPGVAGSSPAGRASSHTRAGRVRPSSGSAATRFARRERFRVLPGAPAFARAQFPLASFGWQATRYSWTLVRRSAQREGGSPAGRANSCEVHSIGSHFESSLLERNRRPKRNSCRINPNQKNGTLKKFEESLRIEPKTSGGEKRVGYLDLRAFQGERQTGGVIVDIGSPLSTIPIVAE